MYAKHNNMTFTWIAIWLKQTFSFLTAVGATVLAFFLPVGGLVLVAFTAIFFDFIVGTMASLKKNVTLDSKKAWRTPQKLAVAIVLICGFQIIQYVMIDPLPSIPIIGKYIENLSLSYLVTFSILWSELLSLAEKLEAMFGWKILDLLKTRFSFILKKNDTDKSE